MNRNKQKILMYAEVARKLSEAQNVYINGIVNELLKIHPDINQINPEDSAENWAFDIINASSNEEVNETLIRLESILNKKRYQSKPLSKEEILEIKIKELTSYVEKLENENKELKFIKDCEE